VVSEIVIGKFLSGCTLITAMIGLTLVFPGVLLIYGNPETGLILSGYLGLYLLAIAYVAVGNFTSALTSNQIIAAVSAIVIQLLLVVISWPAEGAGDTLRSVLVYLSAVDHFNTMVRGVVDTRDLTYFGSLILVFLFLTHRTVESARWK
jgi:ABC-2 type transport system permease protein